MTFCNFEIAEFEIVTDWFKSNKMIVHPDKFQAILLDKRKSDHTDQRIAVDNKHIKVVSSVELLGVQLMTSLISTCI